MTANFSQGGWKFIFKKNIKTLTAKVAEEARRSQRKVKAGCLSCVLAETFAFFAVTIFDSAREHAPCFLMSFLPT